MRFRFFLRYLGAFGLAVACADAPGTSMATPVENVQAATWWVVVATEPSPVQVLRRRDELGQQLGELAIVASEDCENLQPGLFLLVSGGSGSGSGSGSESEANQSVMEARLHVADAYVRECRVRPRSRLALGVTPVHPSIADVPQDAVNWTEEDRVSEVRPLAGGGALLIERRYDPRDPGPLEGQSVAVALLSSQGLRRVLADPCPAAGGVRSDARNVAFHCATEMIADELSFTTRVFDRASGALLLEEKRCRSPVLIGSDRLRCEGVEVVPPGELVRTPREISIPAN